MKTETKAMLFFLLSLILAFSGIIFRNIVGPYFLVALIGVVVFFLIGHRYAEKHLREIREEGDKMWKELFDSLKQLDNTVEQVEKMIKTKRPTGKNTTKN